MASKNICDEITEIIKSEDSTKHEKVICVVLLQMQKDINFIKRLMWLVVSVVLSNTVLIYLIK